jgi:hypothetical protein
MDAITIGGAKLRGPVFTAEKACDGNLVEGGGGEGGSEEMRKD